MDGQAFFGFQRVDEVVGPEPIPLLRPTKGRLREQKKPGGGIQKKEVKHLVNRVSE